MSCVVVAGVLEPNFKFFSWEKKAKPVDRCLQLTDNLLELTVSARRIEYGG